MCRCVSGSMCVFECVSVCVCVSLSDRGFGIDYYLKFCIFPGYICVYLDLTIYMSILRISVGDRVYDGVYGCFSVCVCVSVSEFVCLCDCLFVRLSMWRFFYKKHNCKKHRPTLPKTLRNI